MKRRAVHLAVITSGFLATASVPSFLPLSLRTPDASVLAAEEPAKQKHIAFKFTLQSYGTRISTDGTGNVEFCTMRYKSDDGVFVERTIYFHRSADAATKEMDEMISTSKVAERSTKRDRERKRDVARVVLAEEPSESKKREASVVWVDGTWLWVLHSPSLDHVLELEKQLFPHLANDSEPY